jgi:hypothetical protein
MNTMHRIGATAALALALGVGTARARRRLPAAAGGRAGTAAGFQQGRNQDHEVVGNFYTLEDRAA